MKIIVVMHPASAKKPIYTIKRGTRMSRNSSYNDLSWAYIRGGVLREGAYIQTFTVLD